MAGHKQKGTDCKNESFCLAVDLLIEESHRQINGYPSLVVIAYHPILSLRLITSKLDESECCSPRLPY